MIHPSAQKILDAIDQYWFEHRYAPSIVDIMAITGTEHKSVVLYHMRHLRSAGYILFEDGSQRTARSAAVDHIIHRALDPSYRQDE